MTQVALLRALIIGLAALVAMPSSASAHPGGLNSSGCHNNRKTGDYHCHRSTYTPRVKSKSAVAPARKPPSKRAPIKRSAKAKADFRRLNACPATGRKTGSCPGWEVDHVVPLACGGADSPSNMQWLTTKQNRKKGAMGCRRR